MRQTMFATACAATQHDMHNDTIGIFVASYAIQHVILVCATHETNKDYVSALGVPSYSAFATDLTMKSDVRAVRHCLCRLHKSRTLPQNPCLTLTLKLSKQPPGPTPLSLEDNRKSGTGKEGVCYQSCTCWSCWLQFAFADIAMHW